VGEAGTGGASRRSLTFDEARARLEPAVEALAARRGVERVPLDDSLRRILASPLVAPFPFPRFANSAVDGYALRAAEIARASRESPVVLPLAATVPAGARAAPLAAGHAALVMTGAPLPEGADCVVMRENAEARPGGVALHASAALGENVRPAGEDTPPGGTVLPAGRRIGAAEIAALGAFGFAQVEVVRPPRVAILSTGDELRPPGEPLGPGQIYDSNTHALRALIRESGGEPAIVRRLPDEPKAVEEALRAGLAECDLVLTIGGISMGDFDPVKVAIQAFPSIELWRVAMRPGGPQAFGIVEGTVFYGLPGNPVSSAVVFDRLVRPLLLQALRAEAVERPSLRARMGDAFVSRVGRRDFLRVWLEGEGESRIARLTGTQSSGAVTSLARADGLAIVPESADALAPGDEVEVILWRTPWAAR
jgi:molybdopterin molybdotransferase